MIICWFSINFISFHSFCVFSPQCLSLLNIVSRQNSWNLADLKKFSIWQGDIIDLDIIIDRMCVLIAGLKTCTIIFIFNMFNYSGQAVCYLSNTRVRNMCTETYTYLRINKQINGVFDRLDVHILVKLSQGWWGWWIRRHYPPGTVFDITALYLSVTEARIVLNIYELVWKKNCLTRIGTLSNIIWALQWCFETKKVWWSGPIVQ